MMQRLEYKSMPFSIGNNGDIAEGKGSIERDREKSHAILSMICHRIVQSASIAQRRDNFLRQVLPICRSWYREVSSVTQRLPKSGPVTESAIYARIRFFSMMVALGLEQAEDEMAFHGLRTAFQNLIHLREECAIAGSEPDTESEASGSDVPTVKLSIGAELVATAFFVGSSCRDAIIRRRALRFLESSKRREARWYSPHAAAVLTWLMREEEHADDQLTLRTQRIRLRRLSYFHDLDATSLGPADPALSFKMPSWVYVEYGYVSAPFDLQEHRINVEQSEGSISNEDNTSRPMTALAYQVDEPLITRTVEM